tara:strand:- start:514 stop:741 length:228 start_codon:yes stop_codon:yes gene_type:complete
MYKSNYIGKYNVYNIINGIIVALHKEIIYFCTRNKSVMIQTVNIKPSKKIVSTLKKMMELKEEHRKKILAKVKEN